MKRIASLLVLILCLAGLNSIAQQNTLCNAAFNTSFVNNTTIQFNPVVPGTPSTVLHTWYFGDGAMSNAINPQHTYLTGGVFTAAHYIQVMGNGTIQCIDSAAMTIQLGGSTCSVVVGFYAYPDSTSSIPNTFHFVNTSIPLHSTDSIRWTFGDGSSSNAMNPSHTYTQPGTYNVCLLVQQRDSLGFPTGCIRETCQTIVVQNQNPCNLTVSYYFYKDSLYMGPMPLYHFVNTSSPLSSTDSIRWTFGDGISSNELNPNHIYTQPGIYTVCLRIQKRDPNGGLTNCVRESCMTVVVQPQNTCTLVVGFVPSPGGAPGYFHFENTSTPLSSNDSIIWNFGDGTYSNAVSPNHIYTQPGTYTVCLLVQKRDSTGIFLNCLREFCMTITVQLPDPCNLTANFTATAVAGANGVFHFENTSAPLNSTDSIRWTFGDGTSSSTVSPNHTYTQPGTYNVCLRIQKRDSLGILLNCVREICHSITATALCNVHANFSSHSDSINPRLVYFSNQSLPLNSGLVATWSFGDGTSSTAWNPVHQYTQAGHYMVCLTVGIGNCTNTTCDTVTIVIPPVLPSCMQQSNFTYVRSSSNSQLFTFTPAYINNDWQYTWTFGDGTGSHDKVVTHQYQQAGNYTACLTVYRNANCASTSCKPVPVIPQPNCNNATVSYNYQSATSQPNRLYFQAVSNLTLIDQLWTITKLPDSTAAPVILHQNNPSFVFQDTGLYRVCLKATTWGGCVREYCSVVHIGQVLNQGGCTLQVFPNPATTQVSVNVVLPQAQMIDVFIYNSMNTLVQQAHQQGNAGANTVTVPIANLAPGIYMMKVIRGNSICYAQFVKL